MDKVKEHLEQALEHSSALTPMGIAHGSDLYLIELALEEIEKARLQLYYLRMRMDFQESEWND